MDKHQGPFLWAKMKQDLKNRQYAGQFNEIKVVEVNEMSQDKIDLIHINQQEKIKKSLSICM